MLNLSKWKSLFRPTPETEYERILLRHDLGRRWAKASSWLKFALAGAVGVFIFAAQANGERQLDCLAANLYFEARSEPIEGRLAVSHVVLNRVADRRFPNSVCAVVQQDDKPGDISCQFSWWCDGASNKPRYPGDWKASQALAYQAYWSRTADPTNGALWYHATYAKPIWRLRLYRGPRIGLHVFYWDSPRETVETG